LLLLLAEDCPAGQNWLVSSAFPAYDRLRLRPAIMFDSACTDYAEFAGRLADAGRKIIRERLDSPPQALDKHDGSPVTAIDQSVEDQLRAMIQVQ